MSRASCAQRNLGRRAVTHHRPVAQNYDTFAEVVHLLHEMGNVEDAVALGLQSAHHVEEAAAFWQAQAGGGLIQNQHRGGPADRLCELDQLPLAERQAVDLSVGIDVGADQVVQQRARLGAHRVPLQETAVVQQMRQMDVLGDRQVAEQAQLLVDGADPKVVGIVGRKCEIARTPKQNFSGVGRYEPTQDVLERRFAGAILADQHHDLTSVNGETNVAQHRHTGEALIDPLQRQQVGIAACPLARIRADTAIGHSIP